MNNDLFDLFPFLKLEFYNNSVLSWIVAVIWGLVAWLLLALVFSYLARKLESFSKKTSNKVDDVFATVLGSIKGFLVLAIALFFASLSLKLPPYLHHFFRDLLIFAFLVQGGIWISQILSFQIPKWLSSSDGSALNSSATSLITFLAKLCVWSLVGILLLDNLGIDITALVAGLGVGGIAVALAVQNILGDLLSSLSIVLDKPFEVGDFIIVGDLMGSVERIGIKTTRIRSISGEQLIFANSDLLNSRIRNFKRMYERRVVFALGVTYQTPRNLLEKIPQMTKEIVEVQEQVRFDRAHFKSFGDFSLDFEVVYYVLVPDYNVYMDVQQSINLALHKCFEEHGIEFAYPSQTVFLEKVANS